MKTLYLNLKFLTPAFLGNAEQSGQWRTPPIKALLRQWWRVAYAAEQGFSVKVDEMRKAEAVLFGSATDDGGTSGKSQVRVRLSTWQTGAMTRWETLPKVQHGEVSAQVDAGLYLGYGPIKLEQRVLGLKGNAAIQVGEHATLSLAYPDNPLLDQAITLLHQYGTLGGRSRNGWGSFSLTATEGNVLTPPATLLRPWRDCFDRDWAHAIGSDERGALIWQTTECVDWKAVMEMLAKIKIKLRTNFIFTSGKNAASPEERHWLSYPVTNHSVNAWGNNARLPNSLRFKVRAVGNNRYVGVIFHMPHLPPESIFDPQRKTVETVWQQVHQYLNSLGNQLTRIKT